MYRHLAILLALSALSLSACETNHGSKNNQIRGHVVGMYDGVLAPVSQAQVEIRPTSGGPLLGIAVTNPSGNFTMVSLTNTELLEDLPLQRDTVYQARIEVPGYYILKLEFEYSRGTEDWEFELEERRTDDLGDDTNQMKDGEDEGQLTFGGAVRRG